MILVVAAADDEAARSLCDRWEAHGARLVTPHDLSIRGWRLAVGEDRPLGAVAGGERVPISGVAGVVNLLTGVSERDLPHVAAADREYVAREMRSFVLAWLIAMPCPIVNPPTPTSLSGLPWRREHWWPAAARAGVPVAVSHRRAALGEPFEEAAPEAPGLKVVTVGGAGFGAADAWVAGRAQALAAQIPVPVLGLYFTEPGPGARLAAVDARPDLSSPAVADAVLAMLGRPAVAA